jgi:hypothetical protein
MVRLLGEPFNEQSGSARKAVPSALILGILRQHIFLSMEMFVVRGSQL